jgi:uncharacterized membrane protein (DUF106 family)
MSPEKDPALPNPKPRKSNMLNIMMFALVFVVLFNEGLRTAVGNAVGFVMNPFLRLIGVYDFPVLTIMIAGTIMVALTTIIRHFTTDWLETARTQAMMRHFQKEFGAARKENNTYQLKKLQAIQPKIMQAQQEASLKQMKTMPVTMIVVIPLFTWLFTYVASLDYLAYTAPWNPTIQLLETSVFPHWILLYMTLSVPLGALVQKSMKFISWRGRWQDRHPDVHEGDHV